MRTCVLCLLSHVFIVLSRVFLWAYSGNKYILFLILPNLVNQMYSVIDYCSWLGNDVCCGACVLIVVIKNFAQDECTLECIYGMICVSQFGQFTLLPNFTCFTSPFDLGYHYLLYNLLNTSHPLTFRALWIWGWYSGSVEVFSSPLEHYCVLWFVNSHVWGHYFPIVSVITQPALFCCAAVNVLSVCDNEELINF